MNKILDTGCAILLLLAVSFNYSCNKEKLAAPTVETTAATVILHTSALSGGVVTDEGTTPISSRGICWSTSENPTILNNITVVDGMKGTFNSYLTSLTSNTLYYARAYATNNNGTGYGNQISFTTTGGDQPGTITDLEGNIYPVVSIGTQKWMAENLKTTVFNDGTAIALVTDGILWTSLSAPGYCWYNNEAGIYKNRFGAIYNWYTVDETGNGGKRVCPAGWHVPSSEEWITLANYLGGLFVAGGKIKETGTVNWQSPNTGATNETNFTALPGGSRNFSGSFGFLGEYAGWWSSTEYNSNNAWLRAIYNYTAGMYNDWEDKRKGHSVRCIKD